MKGTLAPLNPLDERHQLDEEQPLLRDSEPEDKTLEQVQAEKIEFLQSRLDSVVGVMTQLSKKMGVDPRLPTKVSGPFDAEARIPADILSGKIITSWKKCPNFRVVDDMTPNSKPVDYQEVEYTTEDGETRKLPYTAFYQMISSSSVPVKLIKYLKPDIKREGKYIATYNYEPEEMIEVQVGRLDPKLGKIYDGPTIKVPFSCLNP